MPFRRHAGASYPKPSSLHALLVIEFFHALLVVEGREAAGIAQGRHLLADSVCSSRDVAYCVRDDRRLRHLFSVAGACGTSSLRLRHKRCRCCKLAPVVPKLAPTQTSSCRLR